MAMNKRIPSGDDVANLLLLFAPPKVLVDFDLTLDSKNDFIQYFEGENSYFKAKFTAQAIFYASYKIVNFRKSYSILSSFDIAPDVVFRLVEFSRVEGWIEEENLRNALCGTGGTKANKLNREDKTYVLEFYDENRWNYKSPRAFAKDVCNSGKNKKVVEKFDAVYGWILEHNILIAKNFYKKHSHQFESKEDAAFHVGQKILNVRPKTVIKWIE
ncbi:hypothetical protein [Methylomonas rosea]|uniref:Uncharacterized protein n=1 Tax=Methylomonas rosea TaxID=2952227 RepID=A0ABT1TYI5_9GAMM|nr:hypothetical protein [Methylomonas sp. WSC-7]MCQ8119832.1 hypothetical protein [Methylomonas sp. WSC-7]